MVVQLREGRTYRDLLGLTASPAVAERLRESVEEGRLALEAQSTIATVLFCDIRGFTRLSEDKDPEYVIQLLNDYMQGVVKVIRDHGGVINKFVGDAALAFFGILPETRPFGQSAREAVSAALAMLDYLEEFNNKRLEQGEEPLRIGVGVNTGPVVAGTMGSAERLEYTVLGDTVNVSQRLSDLNKEYPAYDVFLSADTHRGMGEELRARAVHIGETRVKGRVAPVDVYGLARESGE
jgi:adenylate cyclase